MSAIVIENVTVEYNGRQAVLSADFARSHYHIWLSADRSVYAPLYKTSATQPAQGSASHSGPRRLRIDSKPSIALIEQMLLIMKREQLYERALEDYAKAQARLARERAMDETHHLVIGVDPEGHIHLLADDGRLTRDVREATVFTEHGLDQAQHIARQTDLAQRRRCRHLVVASLRAGDLAQLTGEEP